MLRAAGVPVTPGRCARFAEALALLAPLDRSRVYWAGRATFASSRESAEAYDRVFAGVFGGLLDPAESRGERAAPPPARAGDPGAVAPLPGAREAPSSAPGRLRGSPGASAAGAEAASAEAVLAAASAREVLSARSFDELEEEELAAVRRLMLRLRVATPERRVRRSRGARHGRRLDLRRTIRRSLRTGGDPVRQARRTRRTRRRRLVVICDVSGSMEPYARAFLQLAESAVRGAGAEAFVFSTRLTRVTRALRTGSQAEALCRAAESAPDWSGGTRLAAALAEFLDRYGRRGMARGAVVAIVSDGWESGDPAAVGREMERMRRLAWRIVWVNPRAAAPDFAPLAGGMAAALPHCDVLLSGHSLDALDAVVDAIAAARIE
ncbi:MAG: VWA domain-containing protein [Thermoleophilaceae bacterium]|nr:VWA domain-containing protein [Thermoleophilaceae bacterium]